jgi:photosystem II stability/assembly factor-like uncharacterized protein
MSIFMIGLAILLSFPYLAGAQWVQTAGPGGGYIEALAVSGANIFAGTGDGVFLSADHGKSWKAANSGLPADTSVNCFAVAGTKLFAGTAYSGIFLSTDNGATWIATNLHLPELHLPDYTRVDCLAVAGTKLFVGTNEGILLSSDDGASWSTANSGLQKYKDVNSLVVVGSKLFAGMGYGGVLLSTDNGATWTKMNSGLPKDAGVTCLTTIGSDLYAGTWHYGVFRSIGGRKKWKAVNSGLTASNVECLASAGSELYVAIGHYEGGGTYNDETGLFEIKSDPIYISHGVYKSTNYGASWSAVNSGLWNSFVRCFAASGEAIFAGTDGGVFVSTNHGLAWDPASPKIADYYVNTLVMRGTDLYAGTGGNGIFLSNDNGDSWMAVNSGLPNDAHVTDLVLRGTDLFAKVATMSNIGTFQCSADGMSWTKAGPEYADLPPGNGLADLPAGVRKIQAAVFAGWPDDFSMIQTFAVSGAYMFAGTELGVFISSDNGKSWTAFNSGLRENENILSLFAGGPYLFAGTVGEGVWRRPLSDLSLIKR